MTLVDRRLIALRDCEIIRARQTDPSFRALYDQGLADWRSAGDRADWRLTEYGKLCASRLNSDQRRV